MGLGRLTFEIEYDFRTLLFSSIECALENSRKGFRNVSEPRRPPVFCDLCANLAAAELDGAPLCMTCLLREIGAEGAVKDIHRLVAPLNIVSRRESTPVPPEPRLVPPTNADPPAERSACC
jgi:hypothetical protein